MEMPSKVKTASMDVKTTSMDDKTASMIDKTATMILVFQVENHKKGGLSAGPDLLCEFVLSGVGGINPLPSSPPRAA